MTFVATPRRGDLRPLVERDRFLSPEASRDLLARVIGLSPTGWEISIHVRSRWSGNVRWARNAITTAGDTADTQYTITAHHRNRAVRFHLNRLDDAAIQSAIAKMRHRMDLQRPSDEPWALRQSESYVDTQLWSEATYGLDATQRATLQRKLVEPAQAEGLLSAGYLEVSATGHGVVNSAGLFAYEPETRAEFSVTVRNSTGSGSGWAGVARTDWRDVDPERLSSIAIEKCKRSVDPVAIEPGRYTAILEPQAVSDLMVPVVRSLARIPAEMGLGPWADRPEQRDRGEFIVGDPSAFEGDTTVDGNGGGGGGAGNSKIGQFVLDPRITISAHPGDAEAPFVPFASDGSPHLPVGWIEDGILRELSYSRAYANQVLNKPHPLHNSNAFRVSGANTSIGEMMAHTERGLLVTRFANVRVVDGNSLLCTGTTSDGLWLIERGEITRPVRNFRFRESPLFSFNSLQALGPSVPVLQQMPAVAPAALVHDFSMTSLADAV
jgi:predicted Zn-dependent protease